MKIVETPALAVEAHSDDVIGLLYHETIGTQAVDLHVLTATKGEASTIDLDPDIYVSHGDRVQESITVLIHHGVSPDRQHRLALPDGRLQEHILPLARAIISTAQRHGIKKIYSLAKDDEHSDHVATYMAANFSVGFLRYIAKQPNIQHIARASEANAGYSVTGNPDDKRNALLGYRSQFNEARLALNTPEIIALRAQFETEHYSVAPELQGVAELMVYCVSITDNNLTEEYQAA